MNTPSQAVQEYLEEAKSIKSKMFIGIESLVYEIVIIEIAKMIQLQAHWQKEEEKT